ncbi:MAG: helix-turn-helix domain-containing protein [Thermoleophilaceae bacterium]|nr:helix-turn-helix domain-containing protein [Thermoleophilaceae bacterium]
MPEVALSLGFSDPTVRRLIRQGVIPAGQVGGPGPLEFTEVT